MLSINGVAEKEDLSQIIPSRERLSKGPVAVIECFQQIPCDSCAHICPEGAVEKKGISDIPIIDWDKCSGCGRCVSVCPGLAIFVLHVAQDYALVTMPHEFYPIPAEGETVTTLDRAGAEVGDGLVQRVLAGSSYLRQTQVITVKIPVEQVMDVRGFRTKKSEA